MEARVRLRCACCLLLSGVGNAKSIISLGGDKISEDDMKTFW